MNKIDIQNELIEVLIKHSLTFEEMHAVLNSTKCAIGQIVVPRVPIFKQADGTLTDKSTECV